MKYGLVYGLISGTFAIVVMLAGLLLAPRGSFFHGYTFGYLVILVAMSFVFVGVKRYRDEQCGGVIGFGSAFLTGLGIAAFAAVAYVVLFEIYLAATNYRFLDQYVAGMVQDRQAAGAAAAEVARERAELESMLHNPLVRVPLTFLEIFPVGLVVALISAALLRNPRVLPASDRAKSLSGNEVNPDLQPHS